MSLRRVREDLKGAVGAYRSDELSDEERKRLGNQFRRDGLILGTLTCSALILITVLGFILGGTTRGLELLPFGIFGIAIGGAIWYLSRAD